MTGTDAPGSARRRRGGFGWLAPGRTERLELDTSLPVLVMRVGHYPLHHGTLGIIRSLGRLGVSVHSIAEHGATPAARSRYASGTIVLPTTGAEPADELVAGMLHAAARIGRRAVVVCTDDEAAVLVAEHRDELERDFLLPTVDRGLPRLLASKLGLYELCRTHGVDTPAAAVPRDAEQLASFAETCSFPLMVKNLEAFTRLSRPAVRANTVVADRVELDALARGWSEPYSVLLQEYVPPEVAEDWIAHTYRATDGSPGVTFTGFKLRSWPPYAGVTTCGRTVVNDGLVQLTDRFCAAIAYRGVADLDWRLDHRDGRYKLLDFNPRVGAQFRLFDNDAGVDVVRALHLDLSGRPIPQAPVREGRDLVLEHLDPAAAIGYRREHRAIPAPPLRRRSLRLAWAAPDDPLPAVMAYAMAGRQLAGHLLSGLAARIERGAAPATVPIPEPAGAGLPAYERALPPATTALRPASSARRGAPSPDPPVRSSPRGGAALPAPDHAASDASASFAGDDARPASRRVPRSRSGARSRRGPRPAPERGPSGRPEPGSSEPVEPRVVVSPDDDDDLADDVGGGDGSPVAAVVGDAAAVAEHEVAVRWDPLAGDAELLLGAVPYERWQPRLAERPAVDDDGVALRRDGLSGQADDPLDEILGLGVDAVGGYPPEDDDVAEVDRMDRGRQLVDQDAVTHLQRGEHRA